ncbi:MAG: glycosyltransferase family 87 protein [Xanthobacteraceae bacterium]
MGSAFALMRTGDWVTPQRIQLWAWAALLASMIGLGYLVVGSDGLIDTFGRPVGTDFANVYAAGTYVLDGQPAAPFDPALQYARERAIFGPTVGFYGWHYPPFFLALAAGLALLPYGAALAIWQGVTFAFYLGSIALIRRSNMEAARARRPGDLGARAGGLWLLAAAAYPAVFINLGHGHNGFLTAALLGTALAILDRRPVLAGLLIGLLAYKPQFGLMIPCVLIATGRWRTFAAAAVTVAVLAVLVTLAFGVPVWEAFARSTAFTRTVVLEAGDTGWEKIQGVFSAIRMWGGPVPLAYAGQAVVTLLLAFFLVRLWRSDTGYALKAAALAVAAPLATPYALDYDLMVLAPALAFLACDGIERGFLPYEKSLLAATWLVPLVTRSVAGATMVPLGTFAMLALMALIFRKAGRRRQAITASGVPAE